MVLFENRSCRTLLICWSPVVKSFALQFDDRVLLPDPETVARNILYSCTRGNDTVMVRHRQIKRLSASKLLLTPPVDYKSSYSFRAFVVTKRQHTHKRKVLHYRYSPKVSKITKRSVETKNPVTEPSECGQKKSCFRRGPEGCGHFGCEYFLSYKRESSLLEIELSGNSTGWVAVGFSSDPNMGGDEVIACSKKDMLSNEVQAGTYKNPILYQKPQRSDGEEIVTLIKSETRDAYIYCSMTRPLSSSGHQDLTNDWFQFYASGPVSQGGELEKHLTPPIVSTSKVTVVRMRNVMINTYEPNGAIFISPSLTSSVKLVTFLLLFGT